MEELINFLAWYADMEFQSYQTTPPTPTYEPSDTQSICHRPVHETGSPILFEGIAAFERKAFGVDGGRLRRHPAGHSFGCRLRAGIDSLRGRESRRARHMD